MLLYVDDMLLQVQENGDVPALNACLFRKLDIKDLAVSIRCLDCKNIGQNK